MLDGERLNFVVISYVHQPFEQRLWNFTNFWVLWSVFGINGFNSHVLGSDYKNYVFELVHALSFTYASIINSDKIFY